MRITNEKNLATMVTINLKVSMCRDIIANSNKILLTLVILVKPCDSCNTNVTPLNAIHVHCMDYVVIILNVYTYVHSTYIVSMRHIIH